jgi:hypothetical protein
MQLLPPIIFNKVLRSIIQLPYFCSIDNHIELYAPDATSPGIPKNLEAPAITLGLNPNLKAVFNLPGTLLHRHSLKIAKSFAKFLIYQALSAAQLVLQLFLLVLLMFPLLQVLNSLMDLLPFLLQLLSSSNACGAVNAAVAKWTS